MYRTDAEKSQAELDLKEKKRKESELHQQEIADKANKESDGEDPKQESENAKSDSEKEAASKPVKKDKYKKKKKTEKKLPAAEPDADKEEEIASPKLAVKKGDALPSKAILKLLKTISQHKYAEVFKKPVTVEEAPNYYDVIKEPMDFQTLRKKITDGVKMTMLLTLECREYSGVWKTDFVDLQKRHDV